MSRLERTCWAGLYLAITAAAIAAHYYDVSALRIIWGNFS